ncbi:MAG: methyltransferase [Flavobacteriales bacterium]|jgi:release factor glutamine methyltransferase|nr:methyltransferase [Flavobacteriales bacterium]
MRKLIKKIAFPFLNIWYQKKTSKVNYYTKHGIRLKINPGVFHPGIFLSTNLFIHFINQLKLQGKNFLELGAGSGMISFFAAKSGANVTASDINPMALDGLKDNSNSNKIPITVIKSDLFEAISPNDFDLIIINPPYYPKNPTSDKEQAFFCGNDFEYFKQLFSQLFEKWLGINDIYMILSQDCDLIKINDLALAQHIHLIKVYTTTKRGEKNYIYQLKK